MLKNYITIKFFLLISLAFVPHGVWAQDAPTPAPPQSGVTPPTKPHAKTKKKPLTKPSHKKKKNTALSAALIPPAASHWKPISVVEEKKRHFSAVKFTRKIHRVTKKKKTKNGEQAKITKILQGEDSPARALARVYGSKDEPEIIVSIFPDDLKDLREHLEFRFFIFHGRLKAVKAAMVAAISSGASEKLLDSQQLKSKKMDFSEDFPSSGKLFISTLNSHPGKGTSNSARLELASFGENPILGDVSAEFSTRGLINGQLP
jgi:hypothetical protein